MKWQADEVILLLVAGVVAVAVVIRVVTIQKKEGGKDELERKRPDEDWMRFLVGVVAAVPLDLKTFRITMKTHLKQKKQGFRHFKPGKIVA